MLHWEIFTSEPLFVSKTIYVRTLAVTSKPKPKPKNLLYISQNANISTPFLSINIAVAQSHLLTCYNIPGQKDWLWINIKLTGEYGSSYSSHAHKIDYTKIAVYSQQTRQAKESILII